MTAKPAGTDDPDLNAIGDNHMPEDLRQQERGESAPPRDRPDSTDTADGADTGDAESADDQTGQGRPTSDPA
jgi:hypothetical protein